MTYQFNDGGRAAAGFKGKTGDCGVRAIAIATGQPYRDVYDAINESCKTVKVAARKRGHTSARTGLHKEHMHSYLSALGFKWVPTMLFGKGCTHHVKASELPSGSLVLNLSKHFAAFIDGVLHDTYDSSRDGTRCVYGYWIKN